MINKNSTITLKKVAYKAIAKHTHKMLKYESKVLQRKDPEDLHQMRVAMRRLRSTINGFAIVINLPPVVNQKNIARIGSSLGKLRDFDVLVSVLKDTYRSQLPLAEQKSIDKVLKSLNKQRIKEGQRVEKTLNSRLYLRLKQELDHWLKQPKFQKIAKLSVSLLTPDLLLPQASQMLLNSGWLVGLDVKQEKIEFPSILNAEAIEELLKREDSLLHDLRKSAKKTRYSLELFAQFYGHTYHYYLSRIELIQEILGDIQDAHVLRKTLEKVLKGAIANKMPKLADALLKERYYKWLEWEVLQKEFLQEQTRREFRQAIQQPIITTKTYLF